MEPGEPSPWHQPQWRSVAGFRVPADVFLAGPAAQDRWIIEHHIAGEDWRSHNERFWLRYAARHYAERGRIDDWLGALERIIGLEPAWSEIVTLGLRDAYLAAGEELRGAMMLAHIGEAHPRTRHSDAGRNARCASCWASIGTNTCAAARSASGRRTQSCS